MLRAWDDGVRRQAVELLLPQGQATEDGGWPGGIRQQFRCGSAAAAVGGAVHALVWLGPPSRKRTLLLCMAHDMWQQGRSAPVPALPYTARHLPCPATSPLPACLPSLPARVAKPMVESLLLRLKEHSGLQGRITAELLDEGDCVGEAPGTESPPLFGSH